MLPGFSADNEVVEVKVAVEEDGVDPFRPEHEDSARGSVLIRLLTSWPAETAPNMGRELSSGLLIMQALLPESLLRSVFRDEAGQL